MMLRLSSGWLKCAVAVTVLMAGTVGLAGTKKTGATKLFNVSKAGTLVSSNKTAQFQYILARDGTWFGTADGTVTNNHGKSIYFTNAVYVTIRSLNTQYSVYDVLSDGTAGLSALGFSN